MTIRFHTLRSGMVDYGGPGSGNFGHAGRPGKIGGSSTGKGGGAPAGASRAEAALRKVDEMDAERQWGKLPTSELFADVVPRESVAALDKIASTTKNPPIQEVVLSSLVATQRGVDTETVKEFIRSGDFSKSRMGSGLPVIVQRANHSYIIDGHTRIVAAMMLGKKKLPVQFIEEGV
jgi:hypothetical protein